jgi:hypothetical protein
MDLVYGFVPKEGSLDVLIERKGISYQTSNKDFLFNETRRPKNSESRVKRANAERTTILKNEMPKM